MESWNKPHWQAASDLLLPVINQPRFGLICDFDGTLSLFVDDPFSAVIMQESAASLDALAALDTVIALVSGRGVTDLHNRFDRPYALYYGNHGMETLHEGVAVMAAEAAAWQGAVAAMLEALGEPDLPGVWVENKGLTASVHYRQASDPESAHITLAQSLKPLARRYGLALNEGQHVFEIRPPTTLNKGTAVHSIITTAELNGVIFIGDDTTDLDAMARLHEMRVQRDGALLACAIGVCYPNAPADLIRWCDVTAEGAADVARLLTWIQHARQKVVETL